MYAFIKGYKPAKYIGHYNEKQRSYIKVCWTNNGNKEQYFPAEKVKLFRFKFFLNRYIKRQKKLNK